MIDVLAEVVAKALNKPEKAKDIVSEFIVEYLSIAEDVECIKNLLTMQTWYLCLRRIYETTDLIEIYGFLVEADVPPQSSYTYVVDLTGTKYCCVCPVYVAASDLGSYAKLTNVVNELPVDVQTEKWLNKYAARNRPLPTDIGNLTHGEDYVTFPKRKVRVTFTNTHPSETAHCVFYADYMQMELRYAQNYTENIYSVLVSYAENMIRYRLIDEILRRKDKREEIIKSIQVMSR